MTVQCPRCQVQYRVPDGRVGRARPLFRCARCDLVFSPERPSKVSSRRSANESLSFDFSAEREPLPSQKDGPRGHPAEVALEAELEPEETGDEEEDPSEVEGTGRTAAAEPAFVTERRVPERVPTRARKPERTVIRSAAKRSARTPPPSSEEDEQDDLLVVTGPSRRRTIQPRNDVELPPRRTPLRPIGFAVTAIAAFYLILALALDRNPVEAINRLSQVPLLGQLLGRDHLLAWRLEVTDLDGSLDYIRDNRLAYVVSGKAVNASSQDVRLIEIEGSLLADGAVQRSQRVYAANQARSSIRDLSQSEVEMLLRLEPNRRFVIPPGEAASFLLVFPNPPAGFNQIAVRVVDARAP